MEILCYIYYFDENNVVTLAVVLKQTQSERMTAA
jgi:hypothetical protein